MDMLLTGTYGVRWRTRGFGCDGDLASRTDCFDGVEQEIHKGLLQLVVVAFHGIIRGVEIARQDNLLAEELGLDGMQGMFKNFVEVNRRKCGAGRGRVSEQLAHDGIYALHFAPDNFAKFSIRMFFQQQIHEGFDGDEGVLDFVSGAGGKRADAGEPVQSSQRFFKPPRRGDVVQDENGAARIFCSSGIQGCGADIDLRLAARAGVENKLGIVDGLPGG